MVTVETEENPNIHGALFRKNVASFLIKILGKKLKLQEELLKMLILIIFMLAMAISMMAVPQRERGRLMLMQFALMFVFVMLFMGD